jgi:SAM-dependent methyltransferase
MIVTRDRLLQTYWSMEQRVAPGIRYSQLTYEDVLTRLVQHKASWLDLGCGRQILPHWRREAEKALARRSRHVVGVDIDAQALVENASIAIKCRADATELPFADDSFELVTANMVVEHLEHPAQQFREVARVMKPGGLFIIHTPNAVGYPVLLARLVPDRFKAILARYLDGRDQRDVHPTYYRANSRRALGALADMSSLRILDLEFIRTTPVFGLVPPIALLELLWSRVLSKEQLKHLRTNIIAVLQKHDSPQTALEA